MRPGTSIRNLLIVVASSVVVGVCGILALHLMFNRTSEFRLQAQAGQPIVRAIESFRRQTGSLPASLAELAPKYLPTVPIVSDNSKPNLRGWEYRLVTNGVVVSYNLRYYLGRGGVEYEPPNWMGNDEGNRKVILSNE